MTNFNSAKITAILACATLAVASPAFAQQSDSKSTTDKAMAAALTGRGHLA